MKQHLLALVVCATLAAAVAVGPYDTLSKHSWESVTTGEAKQGTLVGKSVSGLCGKVDQTAGYFNINASLDMNYFYWFFEARKAPSTAPVVMWLTGGPGCSSELALFGENGPCKVNSDGSSTTYNPYSWNEAANMIYVDQPAGVGFSYSNGDDPIHNEKGVSDDLYAFLQAFFKANPHLQGNDFFVFGESYGGHYAPATAHRIYEGNQAGSGLHINLAGLGVGNGLTDPSIQYEWYGTLAYNWTQTVLGSPLISERTYEQMQAAWPQCKSMIDDCQTNVGDCGEAQSYCNRAMIDPYMQTGQNPYDILLPCGSNPLCYNFQPMTNYLNSEKVQKELGVNQQWDTCNDQVNREFSNDWMHDYQNGIPDLLASGTRVLIYAGDLDFICNWIGNKHWTLQLDWPGKADFNSAKDLPWNVNATGPAAGLARTASNFTFLQVHSAGHMVPMDQPLPALKMLETFLTDGKFA